MTETHRRALEWLLRAYEYREVKAGAGPWKLTAALRAALAEIDQLTAAIHRALAHSDRTRLGTVRPVLAEAVNASRGQP